MRKSLLSYADYTFDVISYGDNSPGALTVYPARSHQPDAELDAAGFYAWHHSSQNVVQFYQHLTGNAASAFTYRPLGQWHGGTLVRGQDAQGVFWFWYAPNGPVRLLRYRHHPRAAKSWRLAVPVPYMVWQALRPFHLTPRHGTAWWHGTRITYDARHRRVELDGPDAPFLFRWILRYLGTMQTSEDWVGGHQTLGRYNDYPTKPW